MIAAIIALMTFAMAAANTSFRPCGGLLNTSSIQIHPTYVVPGEDLSITLRVTNGHEAIHDGLLYYAVHANGIDDMPQVDHLCDMIQCPIPFGTSRLKIPLFVPEFSGDATLRIEIMKRDLTPLICVHMETTQSSWLRSIFGGLRITPQIALPAPKPFLALPDSYALSKE